MSLVPISSLPLAGSIASDDTVPIVQSGTTLRAPLQAIEDEVSGMIAASKVINANCDAIAGDRLQVDTSAGVISVTPPSPPIVGDTIFAEDATLSWGTHALTIVCPLGSKINGGTSNYTANVVGGKLSIVYISSAYGWSVK